MSNQPPEKPKEFVKITVTTLENQVERSLKNILKMYILKEGEYHVEEE